MLPQVLVLENITYILPILLILLFNFLAISLFKPNPFSLWLIIIDRFSFYTKCKRGLLVLK